MSSALAELGWVEAQRYGRGDDPADAALDVDLCVIATPDRAIADVAARIEPAMATVIHLSGATPVEVLGRHDRRGGLHPLVSLPNPELGALALRDCWFGVGGDPLCAELAEALSGRWFEIADEDRDAYHAAGAIAANHLTAVLAQAKRIAESIGVPFEPYLDLAASALEGVRRLGPAEALTGPASRGDEETIERHRLALERTASDELSGYDAGAELARRLAAERGR